MAIINIREGLNKLDVRSNNKYDLRNLYDSMHIADDDKKHLSNMLNESVSASKVHDYLIGLLEGIEEDSTPSLDEQAMTRRDALNRCMDLGVQFVGHFDKIYNDNNEGTVRHHASEMQGWLEQVYKLRLKPNGKGISIDKKFDWFFTSGSDIESLFGNPTEAEVYGDFIESIVSTNNVFDSLVAVGLLPSKFESSVIS